MTNEEARTYFIDCNERSLAVAKDANRYNYETQQIEDVFMRREFEAKELAIKALVQQPCGDAISREALKQKLQEHQDFFVNAFGGFKNMNYIDKARVDEIDNCIALVVNAPSVTQSYNSIKTELKPCEDYISRDDAINVAIDAVDEWDGGCNTNRATMISNAIKKLPPVTPQPKTGHWIYDGDCIICNKCLKAFGWISMNMASNFCPNCGADMRGEKA